MTHDLPQPLIDAAALRRRLDAGRPTVLVDCSFDLADRDAGRRAHAEARLPGAQYLHLETDLSGPQHDAEGRFRGRHPLPDRASLAARLAAIGVAPGMAVVAYDRSGGPFAARAWWLLRWLGHAPVAVLDGGLAAWTAAGGAVEAGPAPVPAPATAWPPSPEPALPVIEADALQRALGRVTLVDARAAERWRGEVEPLDAVAGHIPGAQNRFYGLNLDGDGRFLPPQALRAAWQPLMQPGEPVVHQCGSGVTACHNLLAQAAAGLGDGVLYPGSWSEWSADPARPVARGQPCRQRGG
ncbi:sulfurtransferase [Aquabacterium sp. J223]|uniref:sulfurtransferase n=1 Tax=Aquabacterium sp. J223 TaxID=2898431 RepID=UPI0021AE1DF5|nr:sulfurtransferase [Aquabacterium sp. J223]UUX94090.1 sulfurtransferase [Aquabacterium sp. J223]